MSGSKRVKKVRSDRFLVQVTIHNFQESEYRFKSAHWFQLKGTHDAFAKYTLLNYLIHVYTIDHFTVSLTLCNTGLQFNPLLLGITLFVLRISYPCRWRQINPNNRDIYNHKSQNKNIKLIVFRLVFTIRGLEIGYKSLYLAPQITFTYTID